MSHISRILPRILSLLALVCILTSAIALGAPATQPTPTSQPSTLPAKPPLSHTPKVWAFFDEEIAGLLEQKSKLKADSIPKSIDEAIGRRTAELNAKYVILGNKMISRTDQQKHLDPGVVGKPPRKGVVFLPGLHEKSRILFAVDTSRSMINRLGAVKGMLIRDAEALDETWQGFNIVVHSKGNGVSVLDGRNVWLASKATRHKFYMSLEDVTVASEPTDPLPVLKAAFDFQPEIIYFITDGRFEKLESPAGVPEAIARLNVGKRTIIHVIAIGQLGTQPDEHLAKIAKQNGGIVTVVSDEDLEAQHE